VPYTATDADYFFGREYEAREVTELLVAERAILLYSPSGAGKTSLIQARLIPALEKRFDVRPTVRLGRERPGSEHSGPGRPNRYLESALRSLGWTGAGPLPVLRTYLDSLPVAAGKKAHVLIFDQFEEVFTLNPGDIAAKREFFQQLAKVLDPAQELTDGKRPPARYWALFAIREEYLGALDLYLPLLPCRLTNFRLNLLDERKTMAAIQGPAKICGRTVTDEAAKQVFGSLCRRTVVRPGRSEPEMIEASFIDPVHLQIVCQEVWRTLDPSKLEVTAADLRRQAPSPDGSSTQGMDRDACDRIDEALIEYCRRAIESAAGGTVAERELRLWIDRHLITWSGLRGTFTLDPSNPGGRPPATVVGLELARVIQTEERNGSRWLELSHDRLVRPVKASNDRWFKTNLQPHQLAADAWDRAGDTQKASLLLQGRALKVAEAWVIAHPNETTEPDQKFLAASRRQWTRARQKTAVTATLGGMLLLLLGSAGFSVMELLAKEKLEEKNRVINEKNIELEGKNRKITTQHILVRANEFAARAQLATARDMDDAILDVSAALTLQSQADPPFMQQSEQPPAAARDVAKEVLAGAGGRALIGHTGPITKVDVTKRWIITASQDGTVRLWDRKNVAAPERLNRPAVLRKHKKPIIWTAVYEPPPGREPNETLLATVSVDQTVCVWRLDEAILANEPTPAWVSQAVGNTLSRVSFFTATHGQRTLWVCAAGQDGNVYFWRHSNGAANTARTGSPGDRPPDITAKEAHRGRITAIGFLSDQAAVTDDMPTGATSSGSGEIRFWWINEIVREYKPGRETFVDLDKSSVLFRAHPHGATDVSFYHLAIDGVPSDYWLATAGNDKAIRFWPLGRIRKTARNGPPDVKPDPKKLETELAKVSAKLGGFQHGIVDIAVAATDGSENRILVSGDANGDVYTCKLPEMLSKFTWSESNCGELAVQKLPQQVVLQTNPGRSGEPNCECSQSDVTDIDISADQKWVASSTSDGTVQVYRIDDDATPHSTIRLGNGVRSISFSPSTGAAWKPLLVTGGEDEVARVWEINDHFFWELTNLRLDTQPPRESPQRAELFRSLTNQQLLDLSAHILKRRFGDAQYQYLLNSKLDPSAQRGMDLVEGRPK